MLESTDFTGFHNIAQDNSTADILTSYIEKYEKKYLIDLFGFELYELFLDDLDINSEPASPRFVVVYDELYYSQNSSSGVFYPANLGLYDHNRSLLPDCKKEVITPTHSEGILAMLKGFIYFEFVKEYGYQTSQTGVIVNKNENSDPLEGGKMLGLIESRYNDAINSYMVIRNYIIGNSSTYPEFKGVEKKHTHWGGSF